MNRTLRLLAVLVLLLLFGALPASAGRLSAPAATYLVTNTNNSGPNSLRQAIIDANGNPGEDTITFDLAGADQSIRTISINTVLPAITDPVVIDGSTQPDYFGDPLIQLRWTGGDNTGTIGLHITAGDSTVDSLTISGFEDGIRLETGGDNVIVGNFIGTNGTGTAAEGNEYGIHILNSPRNFIGGTGNDAPNLISGNDADGILIEGAASVDNIIQGNYIGTDATGEADLGNGDDGVELRGVNDTRIGGTTEAARNVISGNVISGVRITGDENVVQGNYIGTDKDGVAAVPNDQVGLYIVGGTGTVIGGTEAGAGNLVSGNLGIGIGIGEGSNNRIQGNLIGTDTTGLLALPNTLAGIHIRAATDNIIGGLSVEARNVVSGNESHGINIAAAEAAGNQILGNFVGTDITGNAAIPNNGVGVIVRSSNNRIGGPDASGRNVISANADGGVFMNGTENNLVQSNYIGIGADGTTPLGNEDNGIYIVDSSGTTIGGTTAGAGNVISNNIDDGIVIEDNPGNEARGNSIFSNGTLGIDLENDGVTPNDDGDPDTGANLLQNYPFLDTASTDGTTVTISGTLNSTASTTFDLEFFSNLSCDPSGFGEGESFLGTHPLTTDADGDATFEVTLPDAAPGGSRNITVTATDPQNNTSEFSQCVDVEVIGPTALQLSGLTTAPSLPALPIGAALGLLVMFGVGLVLRRRHARAKL